MLKLTDWIDKDDEREFSIQTNDFYRPDLKQIGKSISDIKEYFCPRDAKHIRIVPETAEKDLKEIHEDLHFLVLRSTFFGESIQKVSNGGDEEPVTTKKGLLVMSRSLAPILNFNTSSRPHDVKCDVFIVLPHKPVTVLSVVDMKTEEGVKYNVSVARGVTVALGRFMDECTSPLYGVLDKTVLKNVKDFDTILETLRKSSSLFVTSNSMSMTSIKYDKVLTAFWAAAAETSSVIKDNVEGDNKKVLRFLSKSQCIILLENIDKKENLVSCNPGCGGSTLMLEVAKRLSRMGKTAILCESREEWNRLRWIFPSTILYDYTTNLDEKTYVHLVQENEKQLFEPNGHIWKFAKNERSDRWYSQVRKVFPFSSDVLWETLQGKHEVLLDMGLEIKEVKKAIFYLETKIDYMQNEKKDDTSEEMDIFLMTAALPTYLNVLNFTDSKLLHDMDNIQHVETKTNLPSVDKRGTYQKRLTYALRTFQHGMLKMEEIFDIFGKVLHGDKKTLTSLKSASTNLEKDFGCPFFLVGQVGTPRLLHVTSPDITFDKDRVNTQVCHLSDESLLINLPNDPRKPGKLEFRNFRGTCTSTNIPHKADSLCPRYFEAHARGCVKRNVLVFRSLFEVGISEQSQVDTAYLVSAQSRSWCISVADCYVHNCVCLKIWGDGELISCRRNIETTVPGSSSVYKFGVVLDVSKGRLAFIDLQRNTILHRFEVTFKEELYPLFGVWNYSEDYIAKVKLVSGRNITMTDEKMSLIHKALCT